MQGSLSPLMLIAGQGLLQNTGLGINTAMQSKIATCEAADPANAYKAALSASYTNNAMFTFANDTCPAITNAIPDLYTSIDPEVPQIIASDGSTVLQEFEAEGSTRLTDLVEEHSNNILGNGDLSKYTVQMFTSLSYAQTAGEFIDGANTANDYLGNTFDSFDTLITGGISGISLAFEELGNDLVGVGSAIDFSNLQHYGTPHSLITTFVALNILEFIYPELIAQGLNPEAIKLKIINLDKSQQLAPVVQKKCYEAFKTVTDEKLAVIKEILRVTSADVKTLADVLDTFKLFPTSRRTLTSVTKDGYRAIYVNDSGSVNEQFKNLGKDYYAIMPKDVCDANQAFKRSLQQVKNITEMNSAAFGSAVKLLETNYGLDDINALTQPLPSDTHTYYMNSFASGSGDNGRFYLSDFVGSPAGIVHNDALSIVNEKIAYLNSLGALDSITTDFNNLTIFLNTTMDGSTSVSIPGYGSYTDHDSGISDVLAGVASKIGTLTTNYPDEVSALNDAYDAMAAQVKAEQTNLALAGVVFSETPSSPSATQSMVANLHSYAIQDDFRGIAELLEKMADTSTRAGQALVGALREGRNLSKLGTVGVGTDALPHDVAQPTDSADISQGKYSLTEALNSIKL